MTITEIRKVQNMIRAIVGASHRCALSKSEAKKLNLKAGRLCDVCEDDVKAYMQKLMEDLK